MAGYLLPLPPMRAVPRTVPLDQSSDAVFEAWVLADVPLTFTEWCENEWTCRPMVPPPPPPSTPMRVPRAGEPTVLPPYRIEGNPRRASYAERAFKSACPATTTPPHDHRWMEMREVGRVPYEVCEFCGENREFRFPAEKAEVEKSGCEMCGKAAEHTIHVDGHEQAVCQFCGTRRAAVKTAFPPKEVW